MTDAEFENSKITIIVDALVCGVTISYKGWNLSFRDNILWQTFEENNITHKSEVTLGKFLKFCNNLDIKDVKRYFGTAKLIKLQNKLLEKE